LVGEVVLRVVHCLIALRTAANLRGIKMVYSHPQAARPVPQLRRVLGVEPRVTYDTAGSVKMINGETPCRRGGDSWKRARRSTASSPPGRDRGLPHELDEIPHRLESGREGLPAADGGTAAGA